MIELLKEMGNVCNRRKVGQSFQDFHRRQFNRLYVINKEQAEAHRQQFLFWSEKLNDMNQHIKQLHLKLQQGE